MKYPLSYSSWDEEEIKAIYKVIENGRYTMGEKTKEYELAFAKYFGVKYALMVNSGSSANLIATAALIYSNKLRPGDEVIVPAVSWSTTYYPLLQYGLKLKFVDIDIDTLNYNINTLSKAVSKNSKMILCVNLLGNPNEFESIISIANANNLLIMEDNCESMGAKYNNRYTGTFGLVGTFSSFYSHHISTIEGGMVVTDDEELYLHMLSLRAHGWTRDLPKDSKIFLQNENSFYESYNFILPGYNLRPLELEAAVGLEQIKKLPNIINERRNNAAIFFEVMKSFSEVCSTQKEIGYSSWFGFSILLKNKLKNKRDELVFRLINAGIEIRPIVAGNFTKNQVIKFFDYSIYEDLMNADYLHVNGFFIGNNQNKLDKELFYFEKIFSSIVKIV